MWGQCSGNLVARRGAWCAVLIVLLPLLFTACGTDLTTGTAGKARAILAAEITQARASGVAPSQIASLQARLRHIDGERGWFGIGETAAAQRYLALDADAIAAENDATAQAQNQAGADLAQLQLAIQRGVAAQATPPTFQQRWDSLRNQLTVSVTPNEYRALDRAIQADLATVAAMGPAHDAITQFGDTIGRMHAAGLPVTLEQAEYTQAQRDFAQGDAAPDFAHLHDILNAEMVGLVNDQAQAIPYLEGALLDGLQRRIDLAHSYGENTGSFEKALTTDQQQLTRASTIPQYLALEHAVTGQINDLGLPLARGQARQDLAQLQGLVNFCQQHDIMDYEYAGDFGLSGMQATLAQGATAQDFQAADSAITTLVVNLRALIANVNDPTAHDQPHATDLSLLQYYQAAQGKTIIISVREQTARMYDHGQLVMWTYITTGRPERPTPPGFWHVVAAQSPITFVSGDDPNSPLYYEPTTVHYALLFHEGGFYLHDAWWRLKFGPGSNLPHPDPAAFNGGSHGCVNVPLQQMGLLYQWAPLGTPVIVY